MSEPPLPPVELANRSGELIGPDGSFEPYHAVGAQLRDAVLNALPQSWMWVDKRVLDFGCGAGRVLRHFLGEAATAEFWGCDIDGPSVEWVEANLNPPMRAFRNGALPPLPCPNASFDLIYAFSVFSHLTESWSAWLLELHRLLKPDGVFMASFLGAGMAQAATGEQWVEDRIGMNVLTADRRWEDGGPTVLLSPWWIREHWGRVFDIESVDDGARFGTHGFVVGRPKSKPFSRAELEHIDSREPRELEALRHNIHQLRRETAASRAELERTIAAYEHSWSWRLTAPLRRLVGGARVAVRGRRRS